MLRVGRGVGARTVGFWPLHRTWEQPVGVFCIGGFNNVDAILISADGVVTYLAWPPKAHSVQSNAIVFDLSRTHLFSFPAHIRRIFSPEMIRRIFFFNDCKVLKCRVIKLFLVITFPTIKSELAT